MPEPTPMMLGKPAIAWDIDQKIGPIRLQPITLKDLQGHVALLEFWRAECPHCEEAVPFMESLFEKYSPQDLKMVTFHSPGKGALPNSVEGNWQKVQAKIKEWGITYPVAYDEGGALFSKYGGSRTRQ